MPLAGKCTMACYAMPAAALILSRTKRSANMILRLHYFESALPIRSVRSLEPSKFIRLLLCSRPPGPPSP